MIELTVKGMDCNHCVQSVTEAVKSVDPAAKVEVDLSTGRVRAETAFPAESSAAATCRGASCFCGY